MQLHGVRTQLGRRGQLPFVRVQKQTDSDPGSVQTLNGPRHAGTMSDYVESPSVVTSSRRSGTKVA